VTDARCRGLLLGLLGLAIGALVAVGVRWGPGGSPDASSLAASQAYVDAVEPLAREGGRHVERSLKPAVARLGTADVEGAVSVPRPRDTARAMRAVHDRWREIDPPVALREAHALFLSALERYTTIAERLAADERDGAAPELRDELVRLGTEADEFYDRAARQVQGHVVGLGGDRIGWLPDPDGRGAGP
jgi:hypothetical protein